MLIKKELAEGQLFKRRDKHQINKRRFGLQDKHQMRTANPGKNTDMGHIAYEKKLAEGQLFKRRDKHQMAGEAWDYKTSIR